MIRAIGRRRSSPASPGCTSAARQGPICCFRSFRQSEMRSGPNDWIKRAIKRTKKVQGGKPQEEMMSRKVSRRTLLASTGAAALGRFPAPAIAQSAPIKIGLLTVKVGPLAQGGIQMEQGVLTFLKETNYTIAGRKVDFISADTGGGRAGARNKAHPLGGGG